MIAECVLNEAQAPGLRADLEAPLAHPLNVGVTWAEHHPVLAKGDRTPVAIGRDVPDGQCRHDVSVPRRKSCMIRANSQCLRSPVIGGVGIVLPSKMVCWRHPGGSRLY